MFNGFLPYVISSSADHFHGGSRLPVAGPQQAVQQLPQVHETPHRRLSEIQTGRKAALSSGGNDKGVFPPSSFHSQFSWISSGLCLLGPSVTNGIRLHLDELT